MKKILIAFLVFSSLFASSQVGSVHYKTAIDSNMVYLVKYTITSKINMPDDVAPVYDHWDAKVEVFKMIRNQVTLKVDTTSLGIILPRAVFYEVGCAHDDPMEWIRAAKTKYYAKKSD